MRDEEDDAFRVRTGALADHVANFVDANMKAAGFEKFFERFAAARFLEFRRGDFGEMNLLIGDPGSILIDPIESRGRMRARARASQWNLPQRALKERPSPKRYSR